MDTKYYKIVADIKESFGAYAIVPMYDETPELAVYESARCSPSIGDYIIFDGQNADVALKNDFFADEQYKAFNTHKKSKDFIKRNRKALMEVPRNVYIKDFPLMEKIEEMDYKIHNITNYIDDLGEQDTFQKIFGGGNKELREAKSDLAAAQKAFDTLGTEYKNLMDEGERYNKARLKDNRDKER